MPKAGKLFPQDLAFHQLLVIYELKTKAQVFV